MTVRQPTDSDALVTEALVAEALVAALAGEAADAAHHPEVDLLLDYHSAKLSSEDAKGVLDHLVSCRRCTQMLLDLESFPETGTEPSNVVNLAAVAGWRDFKSRLNGAQRPAERAQGAPVRALYALAASLLLGVVGLSFWVVDLRQTVASSYLPQTNPLVVTLDPITRGEEGDGYLAETTRESPSFLVRVILGALELPEAVEVELVDATGRTAWSDDDVKLDDSGSVLLIFSRWSLPAGEYRVRVYADGDHREVLDDRKLRVRHL